VSRALSYDFYGMVVDVDDRFASVQWNFRESAHPRYANRMSAMMNVMNFVLITLMRNKKVFCVTVTFYI